MSHRIVSAVVVLVLLLFGASGALYAVGVTPPRADRGTPDGATAPATHRSFGPGTCATCHRPAAQG